MNLLKVKELIGTGVKSIEKKGREMLVRDRVKLSINSVNSEPVCCEKIRRLAYLKWEQAGCPDGRDVEFWVESEKELTESELVLERE